MESDEYMPRQLDFRGRAVALSVREWTLLEEAREELFTMGDVPIGVVVGKLAADATDARSRRPVQY
jgi:hypothetical protein